MKRDLLTGEWTLTGMEMLEMLVALEEAKESAKRQGLKAIPQRYQYVADEIRRIKDQQGGKW